MTREEVIPWGGILLLWSSCPADVRSCEASPKRSESLFQLQTIRFAKKSCATDCNFARSPVLVGPSCWSVSEAVRGLPEVFDFDSFEPLERVTNETSCFLARQIQSRAPLLVLQATKLSKDVTRRWARLSMNVNTLIRFPGGHGEIEMRSNQLTKSEKLNLKHNSIKQYSFFSILNVLEYRIV